MVLSYLKPANLRKRNSTTQLSSTCARPLTTSCEPASRLFSASHKPQFLTTFHKMPLKLKAAVGDAIPPQDAYQGIPSFILITQVPEIRKAIDVELANILFVGAVAYWTFVDFSSSTVELKSFIRSFLSTFDTEGIDLNSSSKQNRWDTTFENLLPAITAYESILLPSKLVGDRLKILKRVIDIKLALPKQSKELAEYKTDKLVTVGDYLMLVTDGINEEYVIGGENENSYCQNAGFNAFMDRFVASKKVISTKRKSKSVEQEVDSESSDKDDVEGDGEKPNDLRGESMASILASTVGAANNETKEEKKIRKDAKRAAKELAKAQKEEEDEAEKEKEREKEKKQKKADKKEKKKKKENNDGDDDNE